MSPLFCNCVVQTQPPMSHVSLGPLSELPAGGIPGALWDVLHVLGWHHHAGACLHRYPGLFSHYSPRVNMAFPVPCTVPERARCLSNTRLCRLHCKGRVGPGSTMRSHAQVSTAAVVWDHPVLHELSSGFPDAFSSCVS